jgi:hypothetical protein
MVREGCDPFMKKIRIINTDNIKYFTVGKEYIVIGEKDISDDGYKCEVVIVVDDDGDEFHICNQQEATFEVIDNQNNRIE